jgi:hypothetical protein
MISLYLVYMTCLVKQKALESGLLGLHVSMDVEAKICMHLCYWNERKLLCPCFLFVYVNIKMMLAPICN